jgi:hypothetical protein
MRNTVSCRAFTGTTRVVTVDEFLEPLFRFEPPFVMHPSAFMFSASVADEVVRRSGRFFRTNGVEYYAWPIAAVFSNRIVFVDRPLLILGRTAKSWGSNVVLSNPGKEQIQKMINDVEHNRDWIPLTNFTLCNLMAEGMLLAKRMFPDELKAFTFDEHQYLRKTMKELRARSAMGVDVGREIQEVLHYAEKYPEFKVELASHNGNGSANGAGALLQVGRAIGLNKVRQRVHALAEARKIRRGQVKDGFNASGADFGFRDAVGCAAFVSQVTSSPNGRA